jgi:hypothetical protein
MGLGEKLMYGVVVIVTLGVTPAGIGPPVVGVCSVPIVTPCWANADAVTAIDAIKRIVTVRAKVFSWFVFRIFLSSLKFLERAVLLAKPVAFPFQ